VDTRVVLFDLDGTLLPMDQDEFVKCYLKLLAAHMEPFGYASDKLIDSIWKGTAAMIMNDGSCTNEDIFWKTFSTIHGADSLEDKPFVDGFYTDVFSAARTACGYTPAAKEVIEQLKAAGKIIVLATNPIFPAVATRKRIAWAGLSPEDFLLYTTYENCSFSKPNLNYYAQILKQIGAKPEECLMVGNDVGDDMVAEGLGMRVFLLTDCLINKNNEDISRFPHGDFEALKAYLGTI